MKTVISVKIDKDVRDEAKKVAAQIGLPLSTIINSQLRHFVAEQRIEFSIPLVPNAKTAKLLKEAIRDIEEGKEEKFSPAFTNAKDAIAWLHSKE